MIGILVIAGVLVLMNVASLQPLFREIRNRVTIRNLKETVAKHKKLASDFSMKAAASVFRKSEFENQARGHREKAESAIRMIDHLRKG